MPSAACARYALEGAKEAPLVVSRHVTAALRRLRAAQVAQEGGDAKLAAAAAAGRLNVTLAVAPAGGGEEPAAGGASSGKIVARVARHQRLDEAEAELQQQPHER